MKGLLLKDLYNLRKGIKQYLLILVFFIVYCFFLKNPSFFPMMTVLSFAMMILTSLSYDEAAGFDKYALTLPVSREDLVRVKYLLFLLLLAAGFVVGLCGSAILNLFIQGEAEPLIEQMASVLVVVTIFLLVFSTMLPIVFKLGVEKARMMMMVCYIVIFAVVFMSFRLIVNLDLKRYLTDELIITAVVIGVIGAALYVLASYFISVRIIRKREW